MKIASLETWKESATLSRPYTIASRTVTDVELFFLRVETESGTVGLGSASPAEEVTGESNSTCAEALSAERLAWLKGEDPRYLARLCRRLDSELPAAPAARVAVEMALHDLFARILDLPLVDLFGRCHRSLPTSITIGIKATIEEALVEAGEYLNQGFHCLKVKLGHDFEAEIELLRRLRDLAPAEVKIRVDANRGYTVEQTAKFWPVVQELDLELVEQPVKVRSFDRVRQLPAAYRKKIAADESLLSDGDALKLLQAPPACGIFNIKLMKCGGLGSALSIARIAEIAGIELMWGCMDESVISISAALHTAFACPNTRYLDLDGSFDLTSEPARGGFVLDDGRLRLADGPGLGVELKR